MAISSVLLLLTTVVFIPGSRAQTLSRGDLHQGSVVISMNQDLLGTVAPAQPQPIACNALPPVRPSATNDRLHAHCQDGDFDGPFYPANDPNVARRIQCDSASHMQKTHHTVVTQSCFRGMDEHIPGCQKM